MQTSLKPHPQTATDELRLSVLSDWLGARSLALVAPGETVMIAEIAQGRTHARYAQAGLRRGAVVRCEGNAGGRVTLRLPSGEALPLEPNHSWFVSVTAPPGSDRGR